jgi:serine/threonine protein kinase
MIPDFLIGSDEATTYNRRVYLFFGSNTSWPAVYNVTNFNNSTGVIFESSDLYEIIGSSIAAGDINGDKIPDLLLGAPNTISNVVGKVYLVYTEQLSIFSTTTLQQSLSTTIVDQPTSLLTTTTTNVIPTTSENSFTTSLSSITNTIQTSGDITTANFGQSSFSSATSISSSNTIRFTTQRGSTAPAVSLTGTGNTIVLTGSSFVATGGPSQTLASSMSSNSLSSISSNNVLSNGAQSSSDSSGIPLGIVIGAAAGGVACITLAIGSVVFVLRRRRKAKSLQESNDNVELANQSSTLMETESDNPNASLYAIYASFKHTLAADIYNQSSGQLILGKKYVVYLMVDRSTADELKGSKGIEVNFSKGIYETEYSLGKGQFGCLLLGKNRETDEFVAVKYVAGEHQVAKSRGEAKLQSLLSGKPNIMPLLDSVEIPTPEGNYLFQVMPIASFGNGDYFYQELNFLKDAKLKEALIAHVAKSLITGLQQMHQSHIYHLDMKPANFVINHDGEVSLIDFGCSQRVSGNDGIIVGGTGDTCYYSPERLAHARRNTEGLETDEINPHFFGAKADAWALGVTLLILMTKDSPFWQADIWQRLRSWDSAFFTKKLAEIPELQQPAKDSIWAVIKGLLEVDHAKRLTMAAALAMPVFERKDLILGKEKLSNAFANIKKAEAESKKAFVYTPKVQNKNYHTAGKVAVSNQQASNSSVAKNPQGFFNPNNRPTTTQDFSKDYGSLPEENKPKPNLYHSRY